MTEELNVTLDSDIYKQVYGYALNAAQQIKEDNPDLKPHIQFRFSSKDPNVMEKLVKNQDAHTFLTMLDYLVNDKFIIQGQIEAKIYYLIFKELGLLKQ